MSNLRAAIIGYGLAGRTFHSQLLKCAGFEIAGVMLASDQRKDQLKADFPSAVAVENIKEIIALKPDLVVVASPNSFHAPQAIELLKAKIPVVVDKPMALNAAETEQIIKVSEQEGVPVTAFFNRRWDSDSLTIKKVLSEGTLGNIFRFEARFERFRPLGNPDSWRERLIGAEGGGKLLDLQPHLLSTCIDFFGHGELQYASVRSIRGLSDDDSFLVLKHQNNVDSYLSTCEVMGTPGPRIRLTGDQGSLVIQGLDPQEGYLREAVSPENGKWAVDTRTPAFIHRGDEVTEYESVPGDYVHFYLQVKQALMTGSPMPVSTEDALYVAKIIDQARSISVR
jgi:scyllo-inositol 2-dehydrogenase (NADP+)